VLVPVLITDPDSVPEPVPVRLDVRLALAVFEGVPELLSVAAAVVDAV